MKKLMAIYDTDSFYTRRLAEYINEKNSHGLTAVAFSSVEKLREYSSKNIVNMLLLGEKVDMANAAGLRIKRIFRLSETAGLTSQDSVYKFQSTEALLRDVMSGYYRDEEEKPAGMADIICVCSPVNRCGKTGFAITLGQILARTEPVLYINLEACSGLSRLLNTEFDSSLSELIYKYRQGELAPDQLAAVTRDLCGLSYIPPVKYGEDIGDITGDELCGLVFAVAGMGIYKTIILDMGSRMHGCIRLMAASNAIYAPILDEGIARAKYEEWTENLDAAGCGDVTAKLVPMCLPDTDDWHRAGGYLEHLLWGAVGEYIRSRVLCLPGAARL